MSAPRSKSLQFWATVEEWRLIRAAARAANARSVSAWLRALALAEAQRLRDPLGVARERVAAATRDALSTLAECTGTHGS